VLGFSTDPSKRKKVSDFTSNSIRACSEDMALSIGCSLPSISEHIEMVLSALRPIVAPLEVTINDLFYFSRIYTEKNTLEKKQTIDEYK
jgi:hypothetical protein